MLLTTSLPTLPPQISSLLPPLHPTSHDVHPPASSSSHPHRRRPARHPNTPLASLLHDERSVSQRKLAIAMYGFSWLKPAGCAKTMLGQQEEEDEKREVERQLREVEMQDRLAAEAEEHERMARLQAGGEPEGGRDLDDDIPDADAEGVEDDDEAGEEADLDDEIPDGDADDGMGADLDDEIPSADEEELSEPQSPDGGDANWVYDTRREPDTPSEPDGEQSFTHPDTQQRSAYVAGVRVPVPIPGSEYETNLDADDAEALANAMLDEDEMLESSAMMEERDLDDDVEEAASGGWEHTDTEDEDEDEDEDAMDISVVEPPAGPLGSSTSTHRRSSAGVNDTSTAASPWTGPATREMAAAPGIDRFRPRRHPVPSVAAPRGHAAAYSPLRGTPQPHSSTGPTTRHARMVSGNRLRHPPRAPHTPMEMTPDGEVDDDEDDEEEEDEVDPFGAHAAVRGPAAAAAAAAAAARTRGMGADVFGTAGTFAAGLRGGGGGGAARETGGWRGTGATGAAGPGTARRTLFGRGATGVTGGLAAAGGGGGAGSGGLFTPEGAGTVDATAVGTGLFGRGATTAAGIGADGFETPVNQAQQQQQQRQQRRRSGRFAGARADS